MSSYLMLRLKLKYQKNQKSSFRKLLYCYFVYHVWPCHNSTNEKHAVVGRRGGEGRQQGQVQSKEVDSGGRKHEKEKIEKVVDKG